MWHFCVICAIFDDGVVDVIEDVVIYVMCVWQLRKVRRL